jgi:hypothetical protein
MSFRPWRVDGADLLATVSPPEPEKYASLLRIPDTVKETFLGIHQSRSKPANAVGRLTARHEMHAYCTMQHAIVFVDWDTARRLGPRGELATNTLNTEARRIDTAFVRLRQIVADHLKTIDSSDIFRVRWRLYHGWYSGQTKTFDLRAVEKFKSELKTTVINKVSFGAELVAATEMLCGGARMPLYDTVRAGLANPDVLRQKMVDTGLVGDLLQSARSARCPSSNDLRQLAAWFNGGFGSPVGLKV